MRLDIKIEGDLRPLMRSEYLAGERAVSTAIKSAATSLKMDWRGQVTNSGLGRRLGNTIRADVYPRGQPSMNAAALIYSKAPKIIASHESGALIRSKDGFWLAIPLPAAGKSSRRGRITPAEWEQKTGRRLRFVYRHGRTALLVDDGTKRPGNVMVRRTKNGLGAAREFRNRTVPMFVLAPQVRLKKRLNLLAAAENVHAGIPAAIIANWRDTR